MAKAAARRANTKRPPGGTNVGTVNPKEIPASNAALVRFTVCAALIFINSINSKSFSLAKPAAISVGLGPAGL